MVASDSMNIMMKICAKILPSPTFILRTMPRAIIAAPTVPNTPNPGWKSSISMKTYPKMSVNHTIQLMPWNNIAISVKKLIFHLFGFVF